MRHSWADISKNVCICRQCGMKRVENKTRYHAHSKPVMTYTRGMNMQSGAGPCENVWPADINPEWRASIYKEPTQAALNFENENEPPPIYHRVGKIAIPERDGVIDLDASQYSRKSDIPDDDIPF